MGLTLHALLTGCEAQVWRSLGLYGLRVLVCVWLAFWIFGRLKQQDSSKVPWGALKK